MSGESVVQEKKPETVTVDKEFFEDLMAGMLVMLARQGVLYNVGAFWTSWDKLEPRLIRRVKNLESRYMTRTQVKE